MFYEIQPRFRLMHTNYDEREIEEEGEENRKRGIYRYRKRKRERV